MTTGRINQVPIVPGERAPPSAPHAGPSCTLSGTTPGRPGAARPAGHGSSAHRFPPTIHLPPLSSPQSGPPHPDSSQRLSSGAPCAPQEEETSAGSRPEAATSVSFPPSVLLHLCCHRPRIHRLHHRPPGWLAGHWVLPGSPGPVDPAAPAGTARLSSSAPRLGGVSAWSWWG